MIRFTDGRGKQIADIDRSTLEAALAESDPRFWNGTMGMACLEYREGAKDQALYVSLAPGRGYYIVLEFTDRSRIYAVGGGGDSPATIWWGGNPFEVPADRIVSPAQAAPILGHFRDTGDPDPDAQWQLLA